MVVFVVALVERRTRDRKVAGSTPGRGAIKSSRSTQPSIPPGYINRVPACMAGVQAGCVNLCRVAGNTVWSHMEVTLRSCVMEYFHYRIYSTFILYIKLLRPMSHGNKTNKPPRYMSDPFDHQPPVPFLPQTDQNDFLSLWPSYTTDLRITQQLT